MQGLFKVIDDDSFKQKAFNRKIKFFFALQHYVDLLNDLWMT